MFFLLFLYDKTPPMEKKIKLHDKVFKPFIPNERV